MTVKERKARRRIQYHARKAMLAVVGKPVVWGRDDCGMFISGIYRAAGIGDPASFYRGLYKSKSGARKALGKGGLPAGLRRLFKGIGWKAIHVDTARIGDVGIVMLPSGATSVIKLHDNEWMGRAENGYAIMPDEAVKVAWSIKV